MAFCSNCGKEISPQAVMCPNCGHPGPGHRPNPLDFGGAVAAAPYASWGQRVGAYLIDALIVVVIFAVLAVAGLSTHNYAPFVILGLFGLSSIVYKPVLEGWRGQTVGKMVLNIKVVRAGDAGPIGYGEAFLRWLIGAVFGFIPLGSLVDLLWPLWDEHKQCLHDKVAKTIVVRL
jgi:uncharacterized RDD family membrane protein YckC